MDAMNKSVFCFLLIILLLLLLPLPTLLQKELYHRHGDQIRKMTTTSGGENGVLPGFEPGPGRRADASIHADEASTIISPENTPFDPDTTVNPING